MARTLLVDKYTRRITQRFQQTWEPDQVQQQRSPAPCCGRAVVVCDKHVCMYAEGRGAKGECRDCCRLPQDLLSYRVLMACGPPPAATSTH